MSEEEPVSRIEAEVSEVAGAIAALCIKKSLDSGNVIEIPFLNIKIWKDKDGVSNQEKIDPNKD